MADQAGAVPQQEAGGFGDNLIGAMNVFVDPVSTAKRVPRPWFWLPPFIISSLVGIVFSWMLAPIALTVLQNYPPENVTPERLPQVLRITEISMKAGAFATPVIMAVMFALMAWLVSIACSILGIQTRFRDLFSMISATSLISSLGLIAGFFVLRAKADEIQSMQQLQPSFGLDIFFPDLKGPLLAILNFFSLFQVWSIVMLTLILAAMTRTSKGKAFAAITPAWLIPLLFKVIFSFIRR